MASSGICLHSEPLFVGEGDELNWMEKVLCELCVLFMVLAF